MHSRALDRTDLRVAELLASGTPDADVCVQLGLTERQFDRSMVQIVNAAQDVPIADNPIALCERALRRRADAEVRSLDHRFRALLETSSEALVVVDRGTQRISDANTRAASLLGVSRRSLIGASIDQIFRSNSLVDMATCVSDGADEFLIICSEHERSGAIRATHATASD